MSVNLKSDTLIIFNIRNELSVVFSMQGVVKKNQVILMFSVFSVLTAFGASV
jgi:hypothetical protein